MAPGDESTASAVSLNPAMAEKAIESDSNSGSDTRRNSTDGDSTKRPPSPSSPPARPYSTFSPRMRTYLTYLLGVTITLSTLTATIYFPLIPLLATHVPGGTVQSINLTVTAYAVAQALAPALFASLADHHSAGRRPVLLALVALYAAASLGLALAGHRSYPALLALRVLQSIGGSPTPAIAYGVAADVAPVAERGAMLGPLLATCNALSAVGPVIGGAVAHRTEGVQGVFWGLMGLAGAVLVAIGFTMPETGRAVVGNGEVPARGLWRTWWDVGERLLKRKTKKNGQSMSSTGGDVESGDVAREKGGTWEEGMDKAAETRSGRQKRWTIRDAVASFRIIFHRDAFAVLWMVASSYSIYYTFQVAIPVIFDEVYGYNELEIGLVFLPGLAGMTLGGMAAGKLVDWNYAVTAKRHGLDPGDKGKQSLDEFPIETARYRFCLLFILVEALLVVGYGWAVWFRVHPSVPIILQFFACALSTLLSHTSSTLLVDIFPDSSSSAYASGQLMRCGLSAASAAVLQPLVDAVGRGWYFTIFSLFVSLTCAGSVLVSLWKGMGWRQKRSKQIASG